MSEDSDFEISDSEINDSRHEKLVEEVLNLNKVQNVKKPSRTEPSLNISEFDLVKSRSTEKDSVQVNDLAKVLTGNKKHLEISNRFSSTNKRSQTLFKPLEKVQAEQIRRTLNYEKTRLTLDRWESLVESNRAASHLVFPLGSFEKIKVQEKKAEIFPSSWRLKSDLQKKLEKLTPKVEEYHINVEQTDDFPLTLKELKEKRKEAAKLRAFQSYKEAKVRRQNKIKSKKYHRMLRKEKIKEKLKEFEELQKTNPEEALKKLEDIEKARAEERFSLRHKGTGQWAKNKQVRAKYDKESRQELAQQLRVSRELTQKLKSIDSDSEEEIDVSNQIKVNNNDHKSNPWINGVKPDKEVADFVNSYKKYWNEKNEKENMKENDKETVNDKEKVEETSGATKILDDADSTQHAPDSTKLQVTKSKSKKNIKNSTKTKKKSVGLKKPIKKVHNNKLSVKNTLKPSRNKKKEHMKPTRNKRKERIHSGTSEWDVEDIFDQFENKLQTKLKKKIKNIQKKSKPTKQLKVKKPSAKKKIDLTMPKQSKKPIIDEELIEQPMNINTASDKKGTASELKKIVNTNVEDKKEQNIDPNAYLQVKQTKLNTAIPDLVITDENEEDENDQTNIIKEAFEDDDIVEDFAKEKAEEIAKDAPKDIDLSLPGWGSWAGTNIAPNKRKRRRFIIKMPRKMPRRDDNKGALIINERAQTGIKSHLVSEVPFPFKTVKDFEASIRAPIGNTFVPETAFRKLIKPAVVTKMGTIIKPIDKSILAGVKKM